MKKYILLSIAFTLVNVFIYSQENEKKSDFWKNVQFGGGLTLGISNNVSTYGISPSAIYNFNDKFSAGVGVSYLYSKYKNASSAFNSYGGSLITLYKPIDEIQLSGEFEQSHITYGNLSRDIPALFLGAGYVYRSNIAVGIRYDVLYDENKSLYGSAINPFVRIYF